MDPNGITWKELKKQLFLEEEIKESEERVKELLQKKDIRTDEIRKKRFLRDFGRF